jgi:hypothetical protein
VTTYIETQLEHHRKLTFEEEFAAFLAEYGIAWEQEEDEPAS